MFIGEDDIDIHAHWSNSLPTDFTLNSEDILIVKGDNHQIVVTFTPYNTEDTLTYTGYNNQLISVSNEGLIEGLSVGETTITIGTENTDIEKTINVTVVNNKLESVLYVVADVLEDGFINVADSIKVMDYYLRNIDVLND